MKITRKQLRRIIQESFSKYDQQDRNVPTESTHSFVWAFKRWAQENLEQDTWNLMGSDNNFQVFLPGRVSLSIKSSESSGLDVYFQDKARNRIPIASVDEMLAILDEKVYN